MIFLSPLLRLYRRPKLGVEIANSADLGKHICTSGHVYGSLVWKQTSPRTPL
jgi:hypothetical protein